MMGESRYRLNAKQSAKGIWQLDITVERETTEAKRSLDQHDVGNTETETMADTMIRIIKDAEVKFANAEKQIAQASHAEGKA
ncbi:MAG: hypothetical protein OXC46_00825 [Thaumarchaeota archaeon]|nr:hypothetical protein [Nitrososphaerota archaeon]